MEGETSSVYWFIDKQGNYWTLMRTQIEELKLTSLSSYNIQDYEQTVVVLIR